MNYCKYCLLPDTRPCEKFSEDGLCLSCSIFFNAGDVDYDQRLLTLKEIIKNFPRKSGQLHDCIIGVSGGKDSTRQALWVREKLGLNPLLVSLSYPPEQISVLGTRNISNLINLGFDLLYIAPSPGTWRKLMKSAFLEFANFGKSTELALYSSVPQIALRYGIKLIFNGEDPGQQESGTLGEHGWDNNNLRYLNTLSGNKEWLLDIVSHPSELLPYRYPEVEEFEKNGLQIIDLGWFLGDWSFVENGAYSCTEGLDIRKDAADLTGDLSHVSALDEDWVSLNQMIKYYKFGYAKVTDFLNEEIRFGRISRDDAIQLVQQYDGSCSDDRIESFCEYIGITVNQFWERVQRSINRDLFDVKNSGEIIPKFKVGVGL